MSKSFANFIKGCKHMFTSQKRYNKIIEKNIKSVNTFLNGFGSCSIWFG